jgi:hypothetical protein
LNIAEEDTEIYYDDENSKGKKITNRIIDYTLRKRKLIREKLKVKRMKIKHRVIIPGDLKRNDLVKSELEYSDYSES